VHFAEDSEQVPAPVVSVSRRDHFDRSIADAKKAHDLHSRESVPRNTPLCLEPSQCSSSHVERLHSCDIGNQEQGCVSSKTQVAVEPLATHLLQPFQVVSNEATASTRKMVPVVPQFSFAQMQAARAVANEAWKGANLSDEQTADKRVRF
jgi:hypothetical protein